MRKILTYFLFAFASTVTIVLFVSATSYTQLAIATLLYPLLAYFAVTLIPHKHRKNENYQPMVAKTPDAVAANIELQKEEPDTIDIDKRAFLKLVAAAGFSFFLYSIFSKRAESVFLGRASELDTVKIKTPDGKEIYPSESQPTDGYEITEIEEGEYTFCGYTNKAGQWYILKGDTINGSFRYTKGEVDFPNSWSKRENLDYDYFYKVFAQN